MTRHDLIKAFDEFSEKSGLSQSTIGQYAARNSRLYGNLTDGKSCSLDTAERIKAWMADNPPGDFRRGHRVSQEATQ